MYNNKFFATKEEAKDFQKSHGGVLMHYTAQMRKEKKLDFLAEIAVALDARGEVIDKEKTPFCVAWNC